MNYYRLKSVYDPTSEIFDYKDFDLFGFYELETFETGEKFRWTHFKFSIKVNNKNSSGVLLCLYNFFCPRQMFVYTKTTKQELNLPKSFSYLYIPTSYQDEIDIFVDPLYDSCDIENDNRKHLGCVVRKITSYSLPAQNIEFIDFSEAEIKFEYIKKQDIEEKLSTPLEENNYTIKFLDFGGKPETINFNPCLFEHNGRKYISTRFCEPQEDGVYKESVKLFDYESMSEINLSVEKEYEEETIQDARFLQYGDDLLMACVSIDCHNYYHHYKFILFDKNFKQKRVIHPSYGKNAPNPVMNSGSEKNWTLFKNNNKLYFIYSLSPHVVVETNLDGEILTEYISHSGNFDLWHYGEPRLSTNPIRIKDYYFSFFHSHIVFENQRIYFCGWYKFKSEPPFNIVETSGEPIIWPSKSRNHILPSKLDVKNKNEHYPLCVFPMGCILNENKLLVSAGINDNESAILTFKDIL